VILDTEAVDAARITATLSRLTGANTATTDATQLGGTQLSLIRLAITVIIQGVTDLITALNAALTGPPDSTLADLQTKLADPCILSAVPLLSSYAVTALIHLAVTIIIDPIAADLINGGLGAALRPPSFRAGLSFFTTAGAALS